MPAPSFTDDEFLAVAALAALAAPRDAGERKTLLRAHESLQGFADAVTGLAGGLATSADDRPSCPLREDRPEIGLPPRTIESLAPSVGTRHLVRVPGVL